MKSLLIQLLCVCLILVACDSSISTAKPKYKIATWKNFSQAALSYTWDDCTPNQLPIAKPIFNKYKFKTTFFVTTDWVTDWPGFHQAAQEGHEIACHTKSHPNFNELTEIQRAEQLGGAQDTINKYITGHRCLTFAYPYCAVGTDIQTASYFISARTCDGHIEKSTPTNLNQVSSISCGSEGHIKTTKDFKTKIDKTFDKSGWAVFLLHGIDGDGGYSPIESQVLDNHLSYVNERRNDFWVATYLEAVKYIRARDAAKLLLIEEQEHVLTYDFKHDLEPLYNIALSIEVELPNRWKTASVMQGDRVHKSQIVHINKTKYIRFNAFVNGDKVQIIGTDL